ncbi:hypothetical protein R1flu_000541 [Riccia fluitans]|uniref:Uncharacterized protein n=1 Tax=Riccia fluitans TaxID=41844 RepID=A0ABD1Y0R5_9MARC
MPQVDGSEVHSHQSAENSTPINLQNQYRAESQTETFVRESRVDMIIGKNPKPLVEISAKLVLHLQGKAVAGV